MVHHTVRTLHNNLAHRRRVFVEIEREHYAAVVLLGMDELHANAESYSQALRLNAARASSNARHTEICQACGLSVTPRQPASGRPLAPT